MSQTWQYPQSAARLGKLHAELLAAVPALAAVVGPDGRPTAVMGLSGVGTNITLTVPAGVSKAAVDAVLAAHDPTTASAGEQQATQAQADLADVRDQAAAIITRMVAIEGAASPTTAQLIQAIRDEATAIKRLTKALLILARA